MKINWLKILGGAASAALIAGGGSAQLNPTGGWKVHGSTAASAVAAYFSGLFVKRPQDA